MQSHTTRRVLRAFWRDTLVLVRQFRLSLLAFSVLLCVGTLALKFFYTNPENGQHLSWINALYATFMLLFTETPLPLTDVPGLQILFIVIPLIGLIVAADGVLRFGVTLFNRQERKEAWQVAIASTYRNHIVVCGLGKVGYRVATELLRLGEEVVGIEHDADVPFLKELQQMKVPVLVGDARSQEMLEKARVSEASAIVVCTDDDLTNLDIALDARELKPDIKVVMRMFDTDLAERVRHGFGIRTAFSTSALAAPVFAAAATRARIDQSFYLDDVLMNVARATIEKDSPLVGRTVAWVEKELDLTVVLYEGQGGVDPHPVPDVTLFAGDCLVVFASLESLARLHEMSGGTCDLSNKKAAQKRRPWLARLFSK
jgi:voltage-gated potassium channel